MDAWLREIDSGYASLNMVMPPLLSMAGCGLKFVFPSQTRFCCPNTSHSRLHTDTRILLRD